MQALPINCVFIQLCKNVWQILLFLFALQTPCCTFDKTEEMRNKLVLNSFLFCKISETFEIRSDINFFNVHPFLYLVNREHSESLRFLNINVWSIFIVSSEYFLVQLL